MSAEQRRQFFSVEQFHFFRRKIREILGIAISERKIEKLAMRLELPKVEQSRELGGLHFYGDLHLFVQDIRTIGINKARRRLEERLYAHFSTMDQEARRKAGTLPIPSAVEKIDPKTGSFFLRAAGYAKDWRVYLRNLLLEKPDGAEKMRFAEEISLAIKALEQAIALSLQETTFRPKIYLEITPLLVSLYPELAPYYGKSIPCTRGSVVGYVYTPSEFHLEGQSSFLYFVQTLRPELPELSTLFISLQQGLMSAYTADDLETILRNLSDQKSNSSLFSPFQLRDDLHDKTIEELFDLCKAIVPFKPLALPEGVNEKSCDPAVLQNYIDTLEDVFVQEILSCGNDPTLLAGIQERIERFSIYLAVAIGMSEELPKDKMLQTYKEILQDKKVATHPQENAEVIDSRFAGPYPRLLAVPFRLESLLECSIMTPLNISGLTQGAANLQSVFGGEFLSTGNLLKDLKIGISKLLENDNLSPEQARAFAAAYGINPEWIGSVIRYYPQKAECAGYGDQGEHSAHWVGQCGEHAMCLACNAQYNLDHGRVQGSAPTEQSQDPSAVSLTQALFGGYIKESLGLGDVAAAATSGYGIFMRQQLAA